MAQASLNDKLAAVGSNAGHCIKTICQAHRRIDDRVHAITKAGFDVVRIPAGPGGVGQIIFRRNGDILRQISAGYGGWNYAFCAVIGHWKAEKWDDGTTRTRLSFVEVQPAETV